ncbi:MAG: DNA polymerase ligase N-terminal domain-containing protein [Candidatus Hodarchaeales archaeon]
MHEIMTKDGPLLYSSEITEDNAFSEDNEKLKFVIQKHNSKKNGFHYDLRLEFNGMLISWVLRKIPPVGFGVKRIATPVDGHPISWADFSGNIEQGYGKGTVSVWDKGLLEWETERPPFNFVLNGRKLKGRYSLIPFQDKYLFYRIE